MEGARNRKRKRSLDTITDTREPPGKGAELQSSKKPKAESSRNLAFAPKELNRRNSLHSGRCASSLSRCGRHIQQSFTPQLTHSSVKDLAELAKVGGPDLQDLRGYSSLAEMPPANISTSSESSKLRKTNVSSTGSDRRISAYMPGFEQNIVSGGVVLPGYPQASGSLARPENYQELRAVMDDYRRSLSPTIFGEVKFEEYQDDVYRSTNEAELLTNAWPTLNGKTNASTGMNRSFAMTPLTDGTIVDPKPDVFYGAPHSRIDPRVRDDLAPYILASSNPRVPVAPNFFTEVKGPRGTGDVALLQTGHNGGVGARAYGCLERYGEKNIEIISTSNAFTIATTFDGHLLRIFSVHTPPTEAGGQTQYVLCQLRSFAMMDTPETFRAGATAYRNLRDWALERLNEVIEKANDKHSKLTRPHKSSTSSTYSHRTTSSAEKTGSRETSASTDYSEGMITRSRNKNLANGHQSDTTYKAAKSGKATRTSLRR